MCEGVKSLYFLNLKATTTYTMYFLPRAFYFFKAKDLEVTPQILRKKDDLERCEDWVPSSQTP